MQSPPKEYVLRFRVGVECHNLFEDVNSIFCAFNIPSWLHPSYKVRLLNRIHEPATSTIIYCCLVDRTPTQQTPTPINLFFFEVYRDNNAHILEYFVQTDDGLLQSRNKMSVRLDKYPQQQMFTITITDHEGFIPRTLEEVDDIMYISKGSVKSGELLLEYNYIEPENIRFKKETQQPHLHLAFQGGGAKGIAYIGAYQAIRELNPHDIVTSVIGSSVGSLCALSIAAKATPAELVEIYSGVDQVSKDRLVRTAQDLTPEILAYYDEARLGIRQFLHEYGVLPNTCFNILEMNYLDDEEFTHSVMDYLLGNRLSVREMLSLPLQEPVYVNRGECCGPNQPYGFVEKQRLINFYGLLQARMLTGESLLKITSSIIKKVLDTARKEQTSLFTALFGPRGVSTNTELLAREVTMMQLYQLTGVELTCTGTDLDSRVLRFFNQKTTPQLPVSMAVLMSASFPLAFEARRWKREWGKYYVHHSYSRLEIDLIGHHFSDGGILANLPVMYLDNEEMRPMLFSHMKTVQTKVYGFGLDEIAEPENPLFTRMQEEKLSDLRCRLFRQTPICSLLCYECCCVPSDQLFSSSQLTTFQRVPPLHFIQKLIETYRYANMNLVMQVFRKKIYHYSQMTSYSRLLKYNVSPDLVRQYQLLGKSLGAISQKLQAMTVEKYGLHRLFSNIAQMISTNIPIETIMAVKRLLEFTFMLFMVFIRQEKKRLEYLQDSNGALGIEKFPLDIQYEKTITLIDAKISAANLLLNYVGVEDYFQNVKDYGKQLQKLREVNRHTDFLSTLQLDPALHSIRGQLSSFFNRFFQYYRQHFLDIISGLQNEIAHKLQSLQSALERGFKSMRGSKNIYELNEFYENFPFRHIEEFRVFSKSLEDLNEPILRAKRIYREEEPAIVYYVDQIVKRRTSNNIHLVLQGRGSIPEFNLEAFKTVREYLREMESRRQQETLETMASLIIHNSGDGTIKPFEYYDLFVLIVARGDLITHLQKTMEALETLEFIDLGYVSYKVSPHVQKQLVELRDSRARNRCRVTNVTTSGLSSYFILMMILGFENERIEEEMSTVSNYFSYNPFDIERKYQSFDWAIPNRCRIRQLQELMWEQRYDLFTAMEMGIDEGNVPLSFDVMKEQFDESRDEMLESFRQVLDYISVTEFRAATQGDPRTYFAQKMSLNINGTNHYEVNRNTAKATRAMVRCLGDMFQNQIKLAIFQSGNIWINDILEGFPDPNIREWLFKGLIIESLINTIEYKKHIFRVFKERHINPDIKLKDFYRISPYKITLTFNAVNLSVNKYVFINHHTHPEMPLWMALISAVSLPLIFPKIIVRPIYLSKINPSEAERKLEILIIQRNQEHFKHLYTSGNLLDPLPLDLLTSAPSRKAFFNNEEYTFLSFGNRIPMAQPQPATFLRKFVKFGGLVNILCTGISYGFDVQPGRIFSDKIAVLNTYLNSHDNYIYQIYKGNLLLLPIRIGTLDFHKIGKGSKLAEEILFETRLSTIEKFSPAKRTYIQFQLNDTGLLVVRMLSRDINNNDLSTEYRLEFKTASNSGYEVLTKRAIEVDLMFEKELYLRYSYIGRGDIQQREYHLDILALLDPYQRFKGTYMLEYSKVINCFLPPLGNTEKLSRTPLPGPPIDMLRVKSQVNIEITGMFCEICCSPLQMNPLYFMIDISRNRCFHCKEDKETRMVCSNKNCPGIYCMSCVINWFLVEGDVLRCHQGHNLVFNNYRNNRLVLEQNVPFVRCACCLDPTEEYYRDQCCDVNFCLKCSSDFILK